MGVIRQDYGSVSGGGYSGYTESYASGSASSTYTLTLENGKTYLLFIFSYSSSSQTYTRYDSTTASGGTITKIDTLYSANGQVAGTWFNVKATSDSVTLTLPASGAIRLFLAE